MMPLGYSFAEDMESLKTDDIIVDRALSRISRTA